MSTWALFQECKVNLTSKDQFKIRQNFFFFLKKGIISKDTEKAIDKTQYSFMTKRLKKLGTRWNFPNLIKSIYKKSTANIKLNGEELDTFPMK